MIDRQALLQDLKPVVKKLEDDLRTRIAEHEPSKALLQSDYDAAKKAGRTAQTFAQFCDDHLTQVAVAWVLATVFVRFVEDNGLCDEPWLSGPGSRLAQARDRYTRWLRQNAELSDREFLQHVFVELGKLPGLGPLLGDGNSWLHRIGPTADGARLLREFWLQVDGAGEAVHLRHEFADPAADTRFLGDLYQDLSEDAQKKYALLQTPIFVEEFLLDRTLEPAIAEFGLADVKLIDPACGSGHFLLGAFARLFAKWTSREAATPVQERARKALEAVAGVDLNPFAVSIARFRLLVAALKVCDVHRLAEAYDFRPRVANGDSLLHGRGGMRQRSLDAAEEAEFEHYYGSEDKALLRSVFSETYQAVVGNPPYIVARDKGLNALYRKRFPDVCHRKYSLGVPFTQLFFEVARPGMDENRAPGFVGMITANSFMKREFGKKLIEQYLNRRAELSHVLDLSGAYIPGHGTPTVILIGRTRAPQSETVRAVLGIKGEPSTPENPQHGVVWSAIVDQVDQPGSESQFVSCADSERERFATHPWSIGGGGAAELKDQIEGSASLMLGDLVESIGFGAILGEDDVFGRPANDLAMRRLPTANRRPLVEGDLVRDWALATRTEVLFPYDAEITLSSESVARDWLWPWRVSLQNRLDFNKLTYQEAGRAYWEYHQIPVDKNRTPLSIAFAEVATHNHFVLDRGGKVFKQTAPVIKLPPEATEDDHLGLLGLLNSSVACFWLRQVCFPKGGDHVGTEGARVRKSLWDERYAFNASNIKDVPLPTPRPLTRAKQLDELGDQLGKCASGHDAWDAARIEQATNLHTEMLQEAIAVQEELDWECYGYYGLIDESLTHETADLPRINSGERAFAIVLARQVESGSNTTSWFERHRITPITKIPAHWPQAYRDLVQRRIDLIEADQNIALIERPDNKRRWSVEPFHKQLEQAQRAWLLDRMEAGKLWPEPHLTSTARFAEQLRRDTDFVQVANLYKGRDDYDLDALVRELVEAEAVPFLPALRYKPSGLRKRADWEATWDLQRRQDQGEDVRDIPVPPKYASGDFLKSSYWKHRGKLDVPKERFVLYPFAERQDDPTLVFTWAGFDHRQQAHALVAHYSERKEQDAATPEQLTPLLAGLRELIPWLLQWHNDPTPEAPAGYGTAYLNFLTAELRSLELTEDDLAKWTPPAKQRKKKASKKKAKKQVGTDPD